MKQISLTQGKFALVDDEDYDVLMRWKWCAMHGYAMRSIYLGMVNGKRKYKTILMHREINKTPEDVFTDHIDHNTLNNCRENLRSCTHSQNIRNMKKFTGDYSSKYKGVYWRKARSYWVATIAVGKHRKYLGSYKTQEEAALAYNVAALNHFGEFAGINSVGGVTSVGKR